MGVQVVGCMIRNSMGTVCARTIRSGEDLAPTAHRARVHTLGDDRRRNAIAAALSAEAAGWLLRCMQRIDVAGFGRRELSSPSETPCRRVVVSVAWRKKRCLELEHTSLVE